MAKKTRRDRAYPTGEKTLPWDQDPAHLKEWRETLGVTQPELAEEAGVSKTLIALIEKGQRPLVQPSRDAIWAAMSGFMYRQAINPTGAFKFWATFFGPLNTGQLMGLQKTPAQWVRDYTRQMQHDNAEEIKELKASNRLAWDNVRVLVDLLDRSTEEALKENEKEAVEEIRENIKQVREREKQERGN